MSDALFSWQGCWCSLNNTSFFMFILYLEIDVFSRNTCHFIAQSILGTDNFCGLKSKFDQFKNTPNLVLNSCDYIRLALGTEVYVGLLTSSIAELIFFY